MTTIQQERPMKDVTPPKATAKASAPQTSNKKVTPPKPAKARAAKPSKAVAIHKPSPPAKTPSVLAIIATAAADPRVQPDKMRALLDLQKEVMADEARMVFTRDFIALQDDLPTITANGKIEIRAKDAKGERTGAIIQSTPFAKFNDIHRVLKPLLKKHGFTLSYATEPSASGERLLVKTFLDHKQGHQRQTIFPLPAESSGSKNNVQGWGASQSYGKRYGTVALLNLVSEAPEEKDTDGRPDAEAEPKGLTLAQAEELAKAINQPHGVGLARFLDKYKIGAAIDLPPAMLREAVDACNKFAAEAKSRAEKK